jgi:hypothetical protein
LTGERAGDYYGSVITKPWPPRRGFAFLRYRFSCCFISSQRLFRPTEGPSLCCILPPFDADQGFAFDKDAGTPCRNLTAQSTCGIYRELAHSGFPGCKHYDCHGAGQYVTALLGLSAGWYESEALVAEAYGLFATAKALHQRMKVQHRVTG